MFKIESYVTPIILSYVDKYVKDFKPADAQVSLWGGGVVLHNLVLKTDVLQQEVALPFTLVSGRIHELLIQVPWTKIISEPIIVTIDTIECILNMRPPDQAQQEPPRHREQVVEAPPGYMQALVRRIVSNISIRIHHLIVKYVHDDIVLSLNVKHLLIDSAGPDWKPTFADIDTSNPEIRRRVVLDDLTLCLDSTDSDGKIRFYQDPLLYRCGLEIRVLAKLFSANTRRAHSFSIELHTPKLAWGITTDQLLLLIRLFKEHVQVEKAAPSPKSGPKPCPSVTGAPKMSSSTAFLKQQTSTSSNAAEPARAESWSEWAWSWMPSWEDRDNLGREEAPVVFQQPCLGLGLSLFAYIDKVSLVIKSLESELNNRKRSRSLLELTASFAAVKSTICVPTMLRVKFGIRYLTLKSNGKCTCGHLELNSVCEEPTIYLSGREEEEEHWRWPQDREQNVKEELVEDVTVEESAPAPTGEPDKSPQNQSVEPVATSEESIDTSVNVEKTMGVVKQIEASTLLKDRVSITRSRLSVLSPNLFDFDDLIMGPREGSEDTVEAEFWKELSPLLVIELIHERSPPNICIDPYDNPPNDFEYSDWEEQCDIHVQVKPMDFRFNVGLIHRLTYIKSLFAGIPSSPQETMRTLTVEECEALSTNLPQRRINVEISDFRLIVPPWDHSPTERPMRAPLLLQIELPKGNIVVAAPLYAHRVCSAAGQMPEDTGVLWQGCRVHTTAALKNIKISILSSTEVQSKPFARIDVRLVTHLLLFPEYFEPKNSVVHSYAVKIREVNVSGSAGRLHAAMQIPLSMLNEKVSLPLQQTSLAADALNDGDLVALDVTAEDFTIRGFMTKKVNTHILTLQSCRATLFHSSPDKEPNQAWLFSGPDVPTSTPYVRMAVQWCEAPFPGSVDYFGIWTEPTAVAIDPLLISWLSYEPTLKTTSEPNLRMPSVRSQSSTQSFTKVHLTSSSSGRGPSRSASYAEQVHYKSRSYDSSSERSGKKLEKDNEPPPKPPPPRFGEFMVKLYERLNKVFITIELGLTVIYVTTNPATAIGCETVRVAMEKHATNFQSVMVFCVGRLSFYTNTVTKHLWYFIQQNGPTYLPAKDDGDDKTVSFPWKMTLADVSCYTLEAAVSRVGSQADSTPAGALKSQLKPSVAVSPHTVLELVSTSVTLSVVTKSVHHKISVKKPDTPRKTAETIMDEAKLRYFTAGTDFKPRTFLEFLRGPARRKKETSTQSGRQSGLSADSETHIHKAPSGPIVSLGFNLHADTPPIVVRMEQIQVKLVAASLHCITHLIALLKRNPLNIAGLSNINANLAAPRSRLDVDEDAVSLTESTQSGRLKTIFWSNSNRGSESKPDAVKTFFWFQWVINRITIVITTTNVKLAVDIDDVSASIDLQTHYDQFKIKIASASIKNFELNEDNAWLPGAFEGRVLEARESVNATEDGHFLAVTITSAQIANLPDSWKEELHPKLLEQTNPKDVMWEIYTVLAPLEVVITPKTLENIMFVYNATSLRTACVMPKEEKNPTLFDLPYCYLNAGGLKLLLACDVENRTIEDTFIFSIDKITITPHPDNPVCRRPVTAAETGWNSMAGNLEGRQYELCMKAISLSATKLNQLQSNQESAKDQTISENPAHKWNTLSLTPTISPILHPLDIDLLIAPALIMNGSLVCGPALELNLSSDCAIELNVDHLILASYVIKTVEGAMPQRKSETEPQQGVCPYAPFLCKYHIPKDPLSPDRSPDTSVTKLNEGELIRTGTDALTVDSGMDSTTTRSTNRSSHNPETPAKKSISVSFCPYDQRIGNPSDYLEVFLTMGLFEVSLYTFDDDSEEIQALRRINPTSFVAPTSKQENLSDPEAVKKDVSKNLSDTARQVDYGWTELNFKDKLKMARNTPKSVPLLHATFYQPNLYYWKRRSLKSLQVSLFSMWFGLGMGLVEGFWRSPILTTARGVPDPTTDIPPALVTLKYTSGSYSGVSASALNQRGTLSLDVERPILIESSDDNVQRIIIIYKLIKGKLAGPVAKHEPHSPLSPPMSYTVRRFFSNHAVDVSTIQTTQIGVSFAGFTVGIDSASLQLTMTSRKDQIGARGLISSFMLSAEKDAAADQQPIIHPVHIGIYMNATWEAWQRAEGGLSAKQPTVRMHFDMDKITVDLTPYNLKIVQNFLKILQKLRDVPKDKSEKNSESSEVEHNEEQKRVSSQNMTSTISLPPYETFDAGGDHYYMDDLRSGAFKIVSGGQMPMAYQVTLNKNVISWRYPHPRAITRLVAFPLPNQNQEVNCVLEFYSLLLCQWEPYINIKLPITEPREISLHTKPPEVIFSTIWRFRVISDDEKPSPYLFNMSKFLPDSEVTWLDDNEAADAIGGSEITAEQLSGILRVDSYFAPQQTPRTRLCVRFAKMDIHLHNSLPKVYKQAPELDGYYVSKPLMLAHRVLTMCFLDAVLHYRGGTSAGWLLLFHTNIASEIFECETGTLEPLVESFKLQAALSVPDHIMKISRVRLCTTSIRLALHISRLRALQELAKDWHTAINEYLPTRSPVKVDKTVSQEELSARATELLEGRVSLWVQNTCSVALRMGQEGTDEILPLGPGTKLAYRWCDPDAPKRLRFAIASPNINWHWSNSVTFAVGDSHVRLVDKESDRPTPGAGRLLFVSVRQTGAHRLLRLSGRLMLANMLKLNLLYKVRARLPDSVSWRTLCSGELGSETIGLSVITATNCEIVLKVRFVKHETGWSGDIPLKECPKENVPWLVKVPTIGDVPYISVWCRVVRARSDGRVIATIWPLYVLQSNLTLDTDVLLVSELNQQSNGEMGVGESPAPLIQTAAGRGARTQLLAPGTTSAKHSLSFQYRNIECPVTREAIPLHYGVTDTSVFDKRQHVNSIDDFIKEIEEWLKRSDHKNIQASWPHSIVSKHWPGQWQPSIFQPRADVIVRYQAIRLGGGGCSLEVQLSPVVILCNATPVSVTLRAHDAAPICKLEPGTVVSPPSIVLTKPFFMSLEVGRETFVSQQLEVCATEPGRYGAPPPGQIAVDHPALFAIHSNHKVTLFNIHYEIKDEISIIGLSLAYVFVNNLDIDVMISSKIVPQLKKHNKVTLRPEIFKRISASKPNSVQAVPLCHFELRDRWRGVQASELALYLCLALPAAAASPAHPLVPLRLATAPQRRPISLLHHNGNSIAAVVTQHKHEAQWVVTLSADPCPQFLIHNRTALPVLVAQPCLSRDDARHSNGDHDYITVIEECAGVYWSCKLNSGSTTYYSSPLYNFRRAFPTDRPEPPVMLTFAKYAEDKEEPLWCQPVTITLGEQMVQLSYTTIKLRVRIYPHSTLIELHDFDHTDLSASDIRNRLIMTDDDSNTDSEAMAETQYEKKHLERIGGDSKVLGSDKINLAMRVLDMKQLEKDLRSFVLEQAAKQEELNKLQSKGSQTNSSANTELASETPAKKKDNDSVEKSESDSNDVTPSPTTLQNTSTGVNGPLETSTLNYDSTADQSPDAIPGQKRITAEKKRVSVLIPAEEGKLFKKLTKPSDTDNSSEVTFSTEETFSNVNKIMNLEPLIKENDDVSETKPTEGKTESKTTEKSIQFVEDLELLNEESLKTQSTSSTSEIKVELPIEESADTLKSKKYVLPLQESISKTESEFVIISGHRSSVDVVLSTIAISSPECKHEGEGTLAEDQRVYDWDENVHLDLDRVQIMVSHVVFELSSASDASPLLAVHVDRTHVLVSTLHKKIKTHISIADIQVDNPQYESGQFDFAVIATTRAEKADPDAWPTIYNMFIEQGTFSLRPDISRVMIKACHDSWTVMAQNYNELTELDFRAGPLALYIEDAYISSLANLVRLVVPPSAADDGDIILAEARSLQKPLRFRLFNIQPIDLTLTLHTAVRMYIALDQSPLHLNAFRLQDMFTSTECLAHALTVHYFSAAILSAGWVVGGLELLGAPGALAARVGGATGGVRGVAAAAAAALLRSLSACAGSLARNLDLLAGDEEHSRRAAAARRRPPSTFVGGLITGFTNFAINILGAVGGLAHHPLVGVAVGEAESGAGALRRGLLGALAKPLSATADLVAYAGHGLLNQTGWDPVPQPRPSHGRMYESDIGWRRDCVRWAFRLAELNPIAGFDVLVDNASLHLLVTHKYLVLADARCGRAVEMIDLRFCTIEPFVGGTIQINVTKNRPAKVVESRPQDDDDDEFNINEAAMQRVARYTGAESAAGGETRALAVVPATGHALTLHALLLAVAHSNAATHFPLL